MKKPGFIKLMAISAVSITLFSGVFIGINHAAYTAAANRVETVSLAAETTEIPTAELLSQVNTETETPRERTERTINVEFANFAYFEPGGNPTVNCMSILEAAEAAADILERLFGVSVDGKTFLMHYYEGRDGGAGSWWGAVMPGDDTSPDIISWMNFTINAETGGLINAAYFPDADEAYESGYRMGTNRAEPNFQSAEFTRTPEARDNIELAGRAMDFAQEMNLFDSEPARARIDRYHHTFSPIDGEPMLRVSVSVWSENSDDVEIGFEGTLDELEIRFVSSAEGTRNTRELHAALERERMEFLEALERDRNEFIEALEQERRAFLEDLEQEWELLEDFEREMIEALDIRELDISAEIEFDFEPAELFHGDNFGFEWVER